MVLKLMTLFLYFSTRTKGEEESILMKNGSLKGCNLNSDKNFFQIFLGDGTLTSFLRGVPPIKKEINNDKNFFTNTPVTLYQFF
jgi:hypothetical protein